MYNYIIKRLLLMIPTLFGVLFLTFIVTQFVPGGPVEQLANQLNSLNVTSEASSGSASIYRGASGLSEEHIQSLKEFYGFDKPFMERFVDLIKNYMVFDLGDSYFHHQSVSELIISKLPVSISLGLWTFIIIYSICIPLGIKKAVTHGTKFDLITSTLILIGYSIPGFVLGIGLIVLLGGGSFYDVFPTRGIVSDNWDSLSIGGKILDYLWHMTLPIISSVIGSFAVMTMLTKNSFIEEIKKQYVLTAKSKGLTDNQILYKHVFKNALIPILTGFPAQFIAAFFTGSILIETIFSLDGIGLLSYESILHRDYPVVLGTLFLFTLLGLIAKLLTDISYLFVDPRIKYDSIDNKRG
ncbi:MAG: microcin ABC transporter permease [Gammaproteobacteria bacterium]|nr:microcin ABC transporter permease [Gammaproteobacteria bacterium]